MQPDTFLIKLKDFCELVVLPLVSYPAEINIGCERKETHVRVYISDHGKSDHGKLVGRGQNTLWSIRCLAQAFAAKYSERVEVQLMEAVKEMPDITVGDDPHWHEGKASPLATLASDILNYVIKDYVGEVAVQDFVDHSLITATVNGITPIIATAVGRIVKSASRMRGRRVEFRATST